MGKNSGIEWTHHTFNPWWGCVKISPACKNCYAEAWSKRVGIQVWGSRAQRRFFGDDHWRQPLSWNREAESRSERRRVFCSSMADVFEERLELDSWRERLWKLIERTTSLDWLLLTKRIESARAMVPWGEQWPSNVWIGTTVETQEWADKRVPSLVDIPAAVRFLSCEPMLGSVDLSQWLLRASEGGLYSIDWVIAGGESGRNARPMHPFWLRDLRDQCVQAGVPFHFKQWGNWRPVDSRARRGAKLITLEASAGERVVLERTSKKNAGRLLDGRFWDEFPRVK